MSVALCSGAASGVSSTREASSAIDIADGTSTTVETQTEQHVVFQDNWFSSTTQQQQFF